MDVSSKADASIQQVGHLEKSFSATELQALSGLTGDDRARMEAQLALQKQQETVSFLSKALKNDVAMQVINALK